MQWIQCVAMSRIYLMIIYVSNGSDWPRYSGTCCSKSRSLGCFWFCVSVDVCFLFLWGAAKQRRGASSCCVGRSRVPGRGQGTQVNYFACAKTSTSESHVLNGASSQMPLPQPCWKEEESTQAGEPLSGRRPPRIASRRSGASPPLRRAPRSPLLHQG